MGDINKRKSRKMSSRIYNKLYAKRGNDWLSYSLWYYESGDRIVTEHKVNVLGTIVLLLLYPFVFILNFFVYGFSGVGDFNKDFIPTIKGKPFSRDITLPQHKKSWKDAVDYIEFGKIPERNNK